MKPEFKVGSRVRLKLKRAKRSGPRLVTRIVKFLCDIPGAAMLEHELGGFYRWNVDDLELVTEEKVKWKEKGFPRTKCKWCGLIILRQGGGKWRHLRGGGHKEPAEPA